MDEIRPRLAMHSRDLNVETVYIEFNGITTTLRRDTNEEFRTNRKSYGGLIADSATIHQFARTEPGSLVLDNAIVHSFAHVKAGEVIAGNEHVMEELGRTNYFIDFV